MATSKSMWWSSPPAFLRYAVAFISVTLAVTLIRGIESYWHSLLFFAIFFSAWFGGFRPGLLAIVLSILAYDYYFGSPKDSFAIAWDEFPELLFFTALAFLVGWLAAAQRKSTESLRKTRDEMLVKVQELQRLNDTLQEQVVERKRAEVESHRSVAFLNKAQKLTQTCSIWWKVATGEIYWSEESYRLMDYDQTTVPTVDMIMARVHPDDVALVQAKVGRSATEGVDMDFRHRLLMPSGAVKHVHVLIQNTGIPAPNFEFLGTIADITEQVRASEALEIALGEIKKSEDRLRTFVDSIPGLAWAASPEGAGEYFNKPWLDYTGLSMQEAVGAGWVVAIHPDDIRTLGQRWAEIMASEKPGEHEARMRRFDGEYRWVLFKAAPLFDDQGKVVRWYGTNTEIEDQKRAENALRRSTVFLAHAQELSHTGSVGFRLLNNTVFWSDETARIYGYDPLTPPTMEMVLQRVHPDDVNKLKDVFARAAQGGATFDFEHRLLMPDGSIKYLRNCAHSVKDQLGNEEVLGAVVDITQQYLAQSALKEALAKIKKSEDRLRTIIDTIPALTWSSPAEGLGNFFGKQWLAYTGLSIEEAHGSGWIKAVHADDLATLTETWMKIRASGKEGGLEARLRRFDGVFRWFLFRAAPLPDETGKNLDWYGVNFDIDDRKRAEETLRRNKAFMADAQAVSHAGSVGVRVRDGKMTWSEETARIYGYDPTILEPTSEMIFQRIHPEDVELVKGVFERMHLGNQEFNFEHRLKMPDGSIKYLHAIARTVKNEEGDEEVLGTLMDITDRKLTQNALNKAQADLAHVTRMTTMSELAASLAHEVKQPLTAVVNNASACLSLLPGDDSALEDVRAALTEIIDDTNRASAVMTRVRNLARKTEIEKKPINLKNLVNEVVALARFESGKRRVAIQTEIPDDLPLVLGDRVQCQQVLLNLVLNGMDAMSEIDPSERILTIGGDVKPRDENHEIVVRVRDRGTGIKPESVDRLFEAFFTTKEQGMGMGLAISRSIIESHGGRLWFESKQGTGATFLFSLPVPITSSSK